MLDFKRLSNGTMVYVPATRSGLRRAARPWVPEHHARGHAVAERQRRAVRSGRSDPTDFPTDQHDYVELSRGGGRAMLSYPLIQPYDLRPLNTSVGPCACSPPLPAICPFVQTIALVDGVIQEIDARGISSGTGVRRCTSPTPTRRSRVRFTDIPLYNTPPSGRRRPAPPERAAADRRRTGDYLVTARHLDAAFRVDRATGTSTGSRGATAHRPAARSSVTRSAVRCVRTTLGSTATC